MNRIWEEIKANKGFYVYLAIVVLVLLAVLLIPAPRSMVTTDEFQGEIVE